MGRPFYGQIVRVRVERDGQVKRRPVVVVTPNESMVEGGRLVGVAVTGTPNPPSGFDVPLPWHREGKVKTGLNRPNAAVCNWFVSFTEGDVIEAIGHVPPEPMRRIQETINFYHRNMN